MSVKKKQKRELTQERIIDTAFEMIDGEGFKSFSMRALGAKLGVSAMACYSHFSSQAELLASVYIKFLSLIDNNPVAGEYWEQTVRRTMQSIRQNYLEHPAFSDIDLFDSVPFMDMGSHTTKIIKLHLDQGMPEEVFLKAWSLIDAYLAGFTMNEAGLTQRLREAEKNSDTEGALTWLHVLSTAYNDETFNNGIDLIIAGIKSLAAPDPCEWYTPKSS